MTPLFTEIVNKENHNIVRPKINRYKVAGKYLKEESSKCASTEITCLI